ncbi:BtrH N-terminal domain-containing protein [Halomicrococcus sp. NG-SE-24]|uniref:BtrH N-terminal domain-containing protein n=1 Tax=Halomicrococcus sp. NG-SE-24 TaxID=3436928 RepID=UPI003D96579C
MLTGYEHSPGAHCGSSSLRNLAAHYGWGFDEPFCFGLGAGLGFGYYEGGPASRTIMGRNGRLETFFFDNLGVDYVERSGQEWSAAWDDVRARLEAGTPVMLFVDLYYLDYFDTSTHFGPHVVLCIGGDEDEVVLSDGEFDERQTVGTDDLRRAWNSEYGFAPLENHWLAVTDPAVPEDTAAAVRAAVERTATVMLDSGDAAWDTQGVAGIRQFAEELPDWHRFEDTGWCARFAYQNVERRGTGGGAFRRLYADFLDQASSTVELPEGSSDRLHAIADDWTDLAGTLKDASEADPDEQRGKLERAGEQAAALADEESAFFGRLRDAVR